MTELQEFLEHLEGQDMARLTLQNYRVNLKLFATWFEKTTGQPMTAAAITPLDVRQYRERCKERFKPGTVNKKLVFVRGFCKWAVATGRASSNPAEGLKLLDPGRLRPKWLTRQQQYQLLRLVQQELQAAQLKQLDFSTRLATRTAAVVVVLLNTGLRVTELRDLRLVDVEMSERGGKIVVRYGKGGKYREVPLNADARRAVQAWLDVRQGEGRHVFTRDNGRPISRQMLQWHVARLGRQIDLHLHPHLLRHTFAKNLVDQGVQLDRVAALLGHSDIGTTAMYTQPSFSDLEKEVQKIQWSD